MSSFEFSTEDNSRHIVVDDSEAVAVNMRKVLPDDVRIQAADGEVWANRSFLCASSEYFSAMLDETKFKEGQEGIGDFKLHSKELVGLVINYFYTGQLSCEDLSISSLLQLEELLRKILLLPQSTKVQDHIKKKLIPWKMPECLAGLVTAKDLHLEASLDEIYNFIINNLGFTCVTSSKSMEAPILDTMKRPLYKRLEIIQEYLKDKDEHTKSVIVSSLDMSLFTKEELLCLTRDLLRVAPTFFSRKGCPISSSTDEVCFFKDRIFPSQSPMFFPQHYEKLPN